MLALRRAQRLVLILMGLHAARLPRFVVRGYVWRNRKINGCWGAAAEHHVHIHLAALFVFNCIGLLYCYGIYLLHFVRGLGCSMFGSAKMARGKRE